MIARKLRLLASVAALAGCGVFATPVIAQGGGIDRTVLPIPLPAFDGVIGRTVEESRGDGRASTPVEAPAGAPNILLILLDDAGYAQTSTFGGPIATPVLDQLAKNGLRYPRFQVDSMCSPTRAALLGGRNNHVMGMGQISNTPAPYPGYNAMLPPEAALVSETLRANGYSTALFGKWHLTPSRELTIAGPFDRWPTRQGFDHFWGFLAAEADQFNPQLTQDQSPTDFVKPVGRDDYTLTEGMADKTIAWIRSQQSVAPNKPFFIYFAPGATHEPQQAPKAWIDRFQGKFDMGWDRYREDALARQKALGIVPKNTKLSPRPPEIPAWASLSDKEKKVQARAMEVFAGMMAQTDYEIGRVIDAVRDTGQLDNTMIVFITGDNGASQEGGPTGASNTMAYINGVAESLDEQGARLAALGGPTTSPGYSAGWAWAGNTPFPWGKRIGSHLGSMMNGMVVSWPQRIKDPGGVRNQFAHVIDVAPTLLEAAKLPQPQMVNGVVQRPMDGKSLLGTFDDASAPAPRSTQYNEMLGNVAIYQDGWMASRRTGVLPWSHRGPNPSTALPAAPDWELYDLNTDFSQSRDLARANPRKLAELKALFDAEARKNQVYPLMPGGGGGGQAQAPEFRATYFGKTRLYAWPPLENRSYTLTASIDVPVGTSDGVIASAGAGAGGWSLYVKDGHVHYTYNYYEKRITTLRAADRLKPGMAIVGLRVEAQGAVPGGPATAILSIDGSEVAREILPETTRGKFSFEDTFDIGEDSGSPVADYSAPFAFPGRIEKVDLVVDPRG
ncbi:MAG: arylsulfatase [Sphingopyxis sp.]|uniref:arylsulfatase n=1 Tax=Sphingopyxis sp. TaxID=1908224 RepID=UPI001A52011B|nr:arylsulfatase [Sphingopyxis sp.]MBL9069169.1 arylsulfatase [Sphingopyxis sp.]